MAGEEEGLKEPQEPQGEDAPQGAKAEPSTDWKAEARKWETRAKQNSDAAAELEKLKEQAAGAADEAAAIRAELDELKAERERAEKVTSTAAEIGVDAALLARMSGDTEEEITANAKALRAGMDAVRVYPPVEDNGDGKPATITREQISAIKDPQERVRVRAQNIGIYK